MGARQKLNGIYFQSCLGIGSVMGLIFGSWTVFFLASIILMSSFLHSGSIRPHQSGSSGPRPTDPRFKRPRPQGRHSQRRPPVRRR
jgi:hypothetical protein